MDIFNLYATNVDAENEGKWFPHPSGAEFLIGRQGNTRYARMLQAEFEAHKFTLDRASAENATPADKEAADILSKSILASIAGKSILLGWRGDVKYQGVPLEFNAENSEKLMSIKDFAAWINERASKMSNYLIISDEADAKNSAPTSTGTSVGVAASSTS